MGQVFMIEFAWPYLFLLIPLPWLIYKCVPESKSQKYVALNIPELGDFDCFETTPNKPKIKTGMVFFIWLLLLTSAARPQWIGKTIEIPQSGRDVMLAVDLSGSMQLKDFKINGKFTDRLSALKFIVSDFIDRRKGDRIGLILFGSNAYLQAPLTFDTATVKQLLLEASIGLAGNETAIGDAIGLAVKQLKSSSHSSRVLILLTDGKNNAGELTPDKAAEIASHEKLKIHTVAIGSKERRVQTVFGIQNIGSGSDIDEKSLKSISEKTGGQYFRAYNTQELIQIYDYINRLESIERTNQHFRPIEEVYYWPLLAAIILSGILLGYESLLRCQS